MRFQPRSLKFRIALLASLLALAAALCASVAALLPMREQVRGLVGNQQLAVLARTAAVLDQDIGAKRVLLRAIAESAASLHAADAGALQLLLERHAVLREEFDNVVVFDRAGQVIANLANRRGIGDRSASRSPLLRQTIATREGGLSEAFRSPLTGRPAVMLAEPVIGNDGQVAVILGGGLSLVNARFMAPLEASRPDAKAYFFLVDERGTILYHPKSSRVLRNVWTEDGGVNPVTRRALEGFEGWMEGYTKEGHRALIAATHLRRTGWTLGLVYPVAEAFKPLHEGESAAWMSIAVVTVLAAAIGWGLVALLLRPLRRLRRRIELLSAGKVDIEVLDSARRDEVGSLSRAFYALSRQRQEAEQRLALLTRTDTLTGLNNRRMFEAELPAALARARRLDEGVALAFFDVDHFKGINDTHGHAVGDAVLHEFAKRLRETVRETDIVARLSGDEFVILFERIDDCAHVEPMIQKLLAAIRRPFHCCGQRIAVTATIGVACGPGTLQAERLLKMADDALYRAKSAGRNTWAVTEAPHEAFEAP